MREYIRQLPSHHQASVTPGLAFRLHLDGPEPDVGHGSSMDPVYEFHPIGLCMRGGDAVRRFYTQFCERFLPLREAFVAHLKSLGFLYVSLDLSGFRSGSMNAVLAAAKRVD